MALTEEQKRELNREAVRKYREANREKIRLQQMEHKREKYAANPEKMREYARQRYAANPEKMAEQKRKLVARNRESYNEKQRNWHRANPEKAKIYYRRYYESNRDKILERVRLQRAENPERCREQQREWLKANPDKRKKYHLKSCYGISPAEYSCLLSKQNNKCAICKVDFTNIKAHVDHDHVTGNVRGLLCAFCNYGLGNFNDNHNHLLAAIDYLKAYDLIKGMFK